MAQTIALQRGTLSLNADNTSVGTLFTQSGGTATRVIVNSLVVVFGGATNTANEMTIMLYTTQSGGAAQLLGMIKTTTAGGQSWQFIPGSRTDNTWTGNSVNSNTSTRFATTQPLLYSTGTNGVPTSAASATVVTYNTTSSLTSANCLNNNFYIGPSDTVQMKMYALRNTGKGNFTLSSTISYSFTTITES